MNKDKIGFTGYVETSSNDWDGIKDANIEDADNVTLRNLLIEISEELKKRVKNE